MGEGEGDGGGGVRWSVARNSFLKLVYKEY